MAMDIGVNDARAHDQARGREARTPREIPKRGWKDILLRVKDRIGNDNLSIIAAGVAFYLFLALFPAIAAAVSVLGLLMEPAEVENFVASASAVLPPDALTLVRDQVHELANAPRQTLGLSLLISVALAIWSATAGVKAIMTALNIAYQEHERRGFIKYNAQAILLTVGVIVFAVIALALVAAVPAVLQLLTIPQAIADLLNALRWVILGVMFVLALAVLYRYAPSREKPQWHWVSWGAAATTVLWLGGSALFSLYVTNFAGYNKTYGALAAIVILLMWFYLTAFAILLGAELNAEMEHQTRADSTTGHPKPMGQRGARVADTVGESR
jgi:membrane protein